MTTKPHKKQYHITVNEEQKAELQRKAIGYAQKSGEIVSWQEYARRMIFKS